ncbi:uncharacterized protein SPSK_04641 [Sporothrix schenckii 1099-18]|uniref:Uncharacterized protein n=1 Tax=Sporothrix schenckii 1099-18 TaxID=1397361 RepID=A0A0F2M2A3_SPOSC|nr:uncharacterized protein SPSK_04641 [Sporothrix schenckii 1099-18]KJR83843.1 hypothetical protein SPSK_04641 [Sporothrix schenckii 1099-18]
MHHAPCTSPYAPNKTRIPNQLDLQVAKSFADDMSLTFPGTRTRAGQQREALLPLVSPVGHFWSAANTKTQPEYYHPSMYDVRRSTFDVRRSTYINYKTGEYDRQAPVMVK